MADPQTFNSRLKGIFGFVRTTDGPLVAASVAGDVAVIPVLMGSAFDILSSLDGSLPTTSRNKMTRKTRSTPPSHSEAFLLLLPPSPSGLRGASLRVPNSEAFGKACSCSSQRDRELIFRLGFPVSI
jgi:hypothetical protein